MSVIISDRTFYLTIGTIISLVLLLLYFPAVAAFIWFLAIGIAILVVAYKSYRKGIVGVNLKYRFVVYERRISPSAFWFYIFVAVGFGILSCVAAILFLFHTFQGQ